MGADMENFEAIVERCRLALEKKPGDELIAMTFSSLEFTCRTRGEWMKLVRVLEARLSLEKAAHIRLEVFSELIRIYEENLLQPQMAFLTACRAYRENMDNQDLRLKLESLAEQTDSIEEMALVYEEALDGMVTCCQSGLAMVRRLAKIKEFYQDEKDEAISLWQQVLWAEPEDEEALSALERLLRMQKDYKELVNVLRKRAKLERSPERRIDIYYEVAQIAEEQLGRRQEAMDAYLRILTEDRQETAAAKLLNRLYVSDAAAARSVA